MHSLRDQIQKAKQLGLFIVSIDFVHHSIARKRIQPERKYLMFTQEISFSYDTLKPDAVFIHFFFILTNAQSEETFVVEGLFEDTSDISCNFLFIRNSNLRCSSTFF